MSRLTRQAYTMLLNMAEKKNQNWATRIKNILTENGYGYIWLNHNVANVKNLLNSLRERLRDCYIQKWREDIRMKDTLSFYSLIKDNFHTENYLNTLRIGHYRNELVKFRLGASQIFSHRHKFNHSHPKICPLCKQIEEDEFHFVLGCEALEEIRLDTLPDFALENRHTGTLAELFTNDSYSFSVAKFLSHAMKFRESISK